MPANIMRGKLARPVKNGIKRMINHCFFSAKILYFLNNKRKIDQSGGFILVYQMGKVGSSSVVNTLRTNHVLAFNVHTFNPHNLKRTQEIYKRLFKTDGYLPTTLWDQQFFLGYIQKNKEKIRIITLVRDPVARNISLFFQHPNMIIEKIKDGYHIKSARYNYNEVIKEEKIQEDLPKIFYLKMDNHARPMVWFDEELKYNFDIDVYSKEFQKEKGYAIYNNHKAGVLLIKLESLSKVFSQAIDDFIGIKSFRLMNANIGSQKDTGDLYDKFLKSFKLSNEYLSRLYESRFTKHFYSETEISAFRNKWAQ